MDRVVLPFPRGQLFGGGNTSASSDTAEYLLGNKYVVKDDIFNTGREVHLLIVRNVSGVTLIGGYMAIFKTAAVSFGKEIDGYAIGRTVPSYPIDHLLASAGFPNNEVGYLITKGPTGVITSRANYGSDIAGGAKLVAQTVNTTTQSASTAGRVEVLSFDASTAVDQSANLNQAMHMIGYALSTCLTNATSSLLLVNIGREL